MKKFICVFIMVIGLVISANNVHAGKGCEEFASLGRTIMEGRQLGVPMVKMVSVMRENLPEEFYNIIVKVIKVAYSSPRYSTEEMQQEAITEFENKCYLSCMGD